MSMPSDLERLHAPVFPLRGQQHGDTPGVIKGSVAGQYEAAKSTFGFVRVGSSIGARSRT